MKTSCMKTDEGLASMKTQKNQVLSMLGYPGYFIAAINDSGNGCILPLDALFKSTTIAQRGNSVHA